MDLKLISLVYVQMAIKLYNIKHTGVPFYTTGDIEIEVQNIKINFIH